MTEHYDELETRSAAERQQALAEALPMQIAHARNHAPHYAETLARIEPTKITDAAELAKLPIVSKTTLGELQRSRPPLGEMNTVPVGEFARILQSAGPLYSGEARCTDYWRLARGMFAAGFRASDLVHNGFTYHFAPGAYMIDGGAAALGCAMFPAGPSQTELQVRAMLDLQPTGYGGTPSFLGILLDKAKEMGEPVRSLRKGIVSGEPLTAALKQQFEEHQIEVRQFYATGDIGMISYETSACEGLIVDEGVIVEIVRPGSGEPVPDGEVGEIVVTNFNREYPLIRFATGDLSAILPGQCPTGRTNIRIKGWMGRADQTTKVRGLFVHPSQIIEIAARHAELGRVRLLVRREEGRDTMTLQAEVESQPEGLEAALGESIRAICKLRGTIELLAPGQLPNDGKIIDDQRPLE